MFVIATLIGIYSYLIFFLGISGFLYKSNVIVVTSICAIISLLVFRNTWKEKVFKRVNLDKISRFAIILIAAQACVNLIGVFGPEISFDALWYHLTLPKLYLISHSIFHIPGGLLYYSDMPKLTETLYVGALSFGSEITAKLIHFSFGILVLVAIYKISRKFLSQKNSLIAALIFYSNLVVGWESITAYVDLSRTFFELLTFWGFIYWREKRSNKWLITSGVMLGLAIATKLIALESLFIFLALFAYDCFVNKEKVLSFIKNFATFSFFSILVPLPWFIFSFINTGNPFYPFFSKVVNLGIGLPNPLRLISDIAGLVLYSSDPITPTYLIIAPLFLLTFFKLTKEEKLFSMYVLIALLVWYFTPKIGGGRFILPYLPVFSILTALIINKLKDKKIANFMIIIIILVSLSSIGYRALANKKYLPVILGSETKSEFLTKNLNFSFGDFYDVDGYFYNNIKSSDRVLLYGFHNLYYVDFPFIDSSWIKTGGRFNYVAVQNSNIPSRFLDWNEIYYNKLTKVRLYTNGGKKWAY